MQILAQSGNAVCAFVGKTRAFGQDEIAYSWHIGDNAFDGSIRNGAAICEIENAKVIKHTCGSQMGMHGRAAVGAGGVVAHIAVGIIGRM